MTNLETMIKRLRTEKEYLEKNISWCENPSNNAEEDIKREKLNSSKIQLAEMKRILRIIGIDYNEL